MIISVQKPLEKIKAFVEPFDKLAIIGCGGCAAVCQTGGTRQVEELADALDDKEIVFTFQIDEPCDQRILSRELRRISKKLEDVDAIVVLACGTGVQVIASSISIPCLTGLDTVFPGTVVHSDNYSENCSACGECVLNITASICPRTLCPKGILNGPCSEKTGENCCVDADPECVWVTIGKRMDSLGMEFNDCELQPLDWGRITGPRKISKKNQAKNAKG